jgi:hypothetical protein
MTPPFLYRPINLAVVLAICAVILSARLLLSPAQTVICSITASVALIRLLSLPSDRQTLCDVPARTAGRYRWRARYNRAGFSAGNAKRFCSTNLDSVDNDVI